MRNALGSLVFVGWLVVACGDDTSGAGGVSAGGSPSEGGGGSGAGGALAGGAAQGGTGGEAPLTHCQQVCAFYQALEDEAACGYDGSSCVVDCELGFEQTAKECRDEAIAFNECYLEQPSSAFTCTGGLFTLTNGACDEQQAALQGCPGGK